MGALLPFPGNDKPSRLNAEDEGCVLGLPVLRRQQDDGGRSRKDDRRRLAQIMRIDREAADWENRLWW